MISKKFSIPYDYDLATEVQNYLNALTRPYLVHSLVYYVETFANRKVKNVLLTLTDAAADGIDEDIFVKEFNFSGSVRINVVTDELNTFLTANEVGVFGIHYSVDYGYIKYKKIEDILLFYNYTPGTPTAFVGGIPSAGSAVGGVLGTPTDGTFHDGLFPFDPTTTIADAIDDINELLLYLAPSPPAFLSGDLAFSISRYSGYLSQSALNFIVYAPGDYVNTVIINQANFILSLSDPTQFGEADRGNLNFLYDSVSTDTFDLLGNFVEAERGGAQTYPPADGPSSYIRILAVGIFGGFPNFQKGDVNVRIGVIYGNADVTGGEHNVRLQHNTGIIHQTNIQRVFYDPESGRPAMSGTPTIVQNAPVYKYLSGIRFYYLGSTFNVSCVGLRIFEYTYIASPLALSITGGSGSISVGDPSISGVTSPPTWNNTMTVTNYSLALNIASASGADCRLTVTPSDPFGTGTAGLSASENRMIDTYADDATALYDNFTSETYRLPVGAHDTIPSPITGQWTSSNVLTNGNAQVYFGNLVYPSQNFLSPVRLPNQQVGTDYSTFIGNQVYYRAMYQAGTPHSNGSLQINGVSWAGINTLFKLELKLPTQTGWLDLGVAYNVATFLGIDGDGVHISHSDAGGTLTINFTCGTFSTAFSGFLYVLRVTLINSGTVIGFIRENGW